MQTSYRRIDRHNHEALQPEQTGKMPDTTPDRKIMPLIGHGMKRMSMAFFRTDDSPRRRGRVCSPGLARCPVRVQPLRLS